jgi:hypothetical protein
MQKVLCGVGRSRTHILRSFNIKYILRTGLFLIIWDLNQSPIFYGFTE